MVSREKQFASSGVPPSHCPETLGGRRPRVDLGGVKKGVEMHAERVTVLRVHQHVSIFRSCGPCNKH